MKLEKISLRNMSDVLTDNEMKGLFGGGYRTVVVCWMRMEYDDHLLGVEECAGSLSNCQSSCDNFAPGMVYCDCLSGLSGY